MSTGWIKLHRRLKDWEWATKPNTFCLFIHLLLNANHEAGTWRGIAIEAGQLATGRHSLSEQTGLSEREIRTSLKHLETTGEVTIKKMNKCSIITIANWDKYQCTDQQNARKTTIETTTNKNNNKKRNKEYNTSAKDDPNSPSYDPMWFTGHVIKLREKDYKSMQAITGWGDDYFFKVLSDRDDWLANNPKAAKNWFFSTQAYFKKLVNGDNE
jgi:hypothetical protein